MYKTQKKTQTLAWLDWL